MRISDCIRINNGQNLKIFATMLSRNNGKVVSLQNNNENNLIYGTYKIIQRHEPQVG